MFQIFEIQGKRFEYSNNIRAKKLSNPNPNIRDSRFEEKDSNPNRIRIYSITSAMLYGCKFVETGARILMVASYFVC